MSTTSKKGFGTTAVYFTALATILGAILFLRFGFAVGTLGFWGVIGVVLLGHLVTIPTALAISEIATNKRVEGGGEYFIISRSFGMNIGATIGFMLFISQAISVAFYIIAFTEAFEFFFRWVEGRMGWLLPRQVISIPALLGLSLLILKRGASVGMQTLYVVVGILLISLIMFFLGQTEHEQSTVFRMFDAEAGDMGQFFVVFAIIFPAFTGMTAGVGLSGDLKKPRKAIPLGTILATITGMVVYFFIVYKLASAASLEELRDPDRQLVMADIALAGGIIIPLGLAASTFSSAIGSILVAPRTLQALAGDGSLPSRRLNAFLSRGRGDGDEPFNATLFTIAIALAFVFVGDVNQVATIISMFFMVTYGSLCLISFLHHWGSSPSYRPSFRSRWFLSLLGFLASIWVMFKINTWFAMAAIGLMALMYLFVDRIHRDRRGLVSIFTNAIFQLTRALQVFLQQSPRTREKQEWRPSVLCISKDSFERDHAYQLLSWISHRYGFGTYLHLIEDYYSTASRQKADRELAQLIGSYRKKGSQVYVDTLISPSYTSAVAQAIQLPGVSGMENNMVLFEYSRKDSEGLDAIVENFSLVRAGRFDVCILGTSEAEVDLRQGIHVWIRSSDYENSHLMILLSFIIQGHPDWRRSQISVFDVCQEGEEEQTRENLEKLVKEGRLPITTKNIQVLAAEPGKDVRNKIREHSGKAGLSIIGFTLSLLKHRGRTLFEGFEGMGDILFVNAHSQKEID